MTGRHKKRFSVFLWHRRLGLLALVLVMILALTGMLLNHTESLSLDEIPIESDWLLDWYGLNPHSMPRSYAVDDQLITQWDDQLFFNQQPVTQSSQPIRGAAMVMDMVAIALQHSLLLLDRDGALIEQINTQTDFSSIQRLGIRQGRLLIETDAGRYFQSDEQIVNWSKVDETTVNGTTGSDARVQWSQASELEPQLKQSLLRVYRGKGLTLERVLLDLHSGRLFNDRWGVYIMDASALIMLWLGFSGTWVWWSRRRKIQRKKHYRKHHR